MNLVEALERRREIIDFVEEVLCSFQIIDDSTESRDIAEELSHCLIEKGWLQ